MSTTLTKKQQKALLFRQKQKAKKLDIPVPGDLPEEDTVQDGDEEEKTVEAGSSSAKKRKHEDLVMDDGKRKTIGKGKGKAWDEEEEGEAAAGKKKSKKEVKQRFILFVGNIGYKTTSQDIQAHFKEAAGHIPSVRLLTTKALPGQPSKSRGIAFLELNSSAEMQSCLKLHHSTLSNRTINVELTAGGGGKTEARKGKIAGRNERVGGQRERRAEKEREAAIEAGEVVPDAAQPATEAGGAGDKVRMRGGRRVKAKTKPADDSAANADTTLPGWSKRTASIPPKNKFHRKFELTGANAVTVG